MADIPVPFLRTQYACAICYVASAGRLRMMDNTRYYNVSSGTTTTEGIYVTLNSSGNITIKAILAGTVYAPSSGVLVAHPLDVGQSVNLVNIGNDTILFRADL